ncbi:RHS repeat-associated core domain-containing protein [Streptomyces sp. NPDC058691]|uniref:RHS repeat-associated core domain-containing protein n=1 Tax=Streptomyces sp. NPDC058691 TaxID=3346601 RepID=UPI00364D2800
MVATRTAGSSGTDAGTLHYTYYTADGSGTCGVRPEWAGLLCKATPAGAIAGGLGNPTEGITTVDTYNRWGQVATKAETANGVTRTSTYVFDTAGRPTKSTITGGSGQAIPATTITYNPGNGQIASRASNGKTVAYTYDNLGRRFSYDDGAGNTVSTAYDENDRTVKITDSAPSTVTFAYDTAGNLKSTTDSIAGTFTGTYDANGRLVTETLPGNTTLSLTIDPAGQQSSRNYSAADGTPLAADAASYTIRGKIAGHTETTGTTTQSDYTYDDGQLTQAVDSTPNGCITRAYTLDANSNRTVQTTSLDDCDSSTEDIQKVTTSRTYDSADRLVGAGYTYDALGRTTTNGNNAAAFTYYVNDYVASETLGTSRNSWTLDAAGRLAVRTSETQVNGTWSTNNITTNHYACDCDSPSWTKTNTGGISRNVIDLTGTLTATTAATGGTVLQLSNLHGDITVQYPTDTTQSVTVQHYDEFGGLSDQTAPTPYGSLGGYQRSAQTLSGVTLMGARLYDPTTGRFLSPDPVYGGNANPYSYPADPVNHFDLNGLAIDKKHNKNSFGCGYFSCTLKMSRRRTNMLIDVLNAASITKGMLATALGVGVWASVVSAGWAAVLLIVLAAISYAVVQALTWLLKYYPTKGTYIKIMRVTHYSYTWHQ